MLSSGIIDLSVGIVFVFGVTAAIASVATELIARLFGLRGAYLLLGLRELLDSQGTPVSLGDAEGDFGKARTLINERAKALPPGGAVTRAPAPAPGPHPPGPDDPTSTTSALLGSSILRNQGIAGQMKTRPLSLAPAENGQNKPAPLPMADDGTGWLRKIWPLSKIPGKQTRRLRRSLPAYIPARSFAEAVIDLVVPDTDGQTTMNSVQRYIGLLPDSMAPLKTSLDAMAADAAGDMTRFRTSVEYWYDDHMDRVSGWYKRHVTKITLAAGAILVLLFNINTITISRALYSDSTVRSAVSQVAAKGTTCQAPSPSPSPGPGEVQGQLNCLGNLETQLTAAAQAGLPLGWGTVAQCAGPDAHCNWWEQRGIVSPHGNPVWQVILVLLGFLITVAAIAPGAQFWFGLLTKLGSLRSSGPPPAAPAG
jgi:hypothetical protein